MQRVKNTLKFSGGVVVGLAGTYAIVSLNPTLSKKADAWLFDKTLTAYNEIASVKKSVHLGPLRETVSKDPTLHAQGRFRVLDVGCGSGVNAPYYPKNAVVVAVDPNEEFQKFFRKRLEQSRVELENYIVGKGEDMSAVQSNSVDAAITTMTLCHADDGPKFLGEIKRVLAPGAKYYFWEHIHPFHEHHHDAKHGAKKHHADRSLHKNVMFVLKLIVGSYSSGKHGHGHEHGHKHGKEEQMSGEEELIRNAGFSQVTCKVFYLKDEVPQEEVETFSWFTRRCFEFFKDKAHIRGVAVK